MSILYRLLGIPRILDEFVDKVKRRGDSQVDVTIETATDSWGCDPGWNVFYTVGVRAGGTRLRLNRFTHCTAGLDIDILIKEANVTRDYLNKAVETAKRIQRYGLKATIEGKPIERKEEAIRACEKRIDALKKAKPNVPPTAWLALR